jgi:hypothetical protein
MAVDTLDKRASAHRAANPWARILPLADGNVAAADRAHAAGFYGGLLEGDELVLYPIASKTGPAIYEPMFGEALD